MFDMMSHIRNAKLGDSIVLRKITEVTGCIVGANVTLYFVELNEHKQYVKVSLDQAGVNKVRLPLRSIQEIIAKDGTVIYRADPRDMVYGQ